MSTLGQQPDSQIRDPDYFKPLPKPRLTEDEFVQWCDEDTRAEWVDGEVVMMSPANNQHVLMTAFLVRVIGEFVESHDLGQVFLIESQVRLAKQKTRRLPDIFFVAQDRLHIVKKTYTDGSPDLIIEIVSPDSPCATGGKNTSNTKQRESASIG